MEHKEIDLGSYIRIIKKRLWLIVLCVFISTLSMAVYSYYDYQPIYQASTKLIVNKTMEMDQLGKEQMDFGAIGINIKLIDTYKEIIKTPAIMDKVVQRYPDLNLSAEELISKVNVYALNDTQVMTITAYDSSYERAVLIVNAVSDVFQTEIPKIMKVDNVAILNIAIMTDHPQPLNKKQNQYIILSFVASLMLAIGIVFLLDSLDDTLKTEKDIQLVLGISTLSMIPKMKKRELKLKKKKKSSKRAGEGLYASINN